MSANYMSAKADFSSHRPRRTAGLLAALAASMLAGACSSGGSLDGLDSMLGSAPPSADPAADRMANASGGATAPKTELDKALAYWSEEHKKKPAELKVALAYAKNLKAAGHKEQAYSVLQNASMIHGDSKELASEMGRLALEYDHVALAEKLLAMADDPLKPDWRLISARGTVYAKQNKFPEAIQLFDRALALAPNQSSVLNNLAMAHAGNGEPAKAEEILRKAAVSSRDPKIKQNLALVLGLQGKHDEAITARAGAAPQTTAVADTEYIKQMVKATPTSIPAQATPAVMTTPRAARPAPQQARVIEAKSTTTRPASGSGVMRPAEGPGAVGSPAGAWSTSVSATR
jgi:Flp pilus assembly protein TadD